jgi:gliding motility-associated-like protein
MTSNKNIYLLVLYIIGLSQLAQAQITAPNSLGSFSTAYTNGSTNDSIYYFCAVGADTSTGELIATPSIPGSNLTFEWNKYDSTVFNFIPYQTQTGQSTSTLNNLSSGGYKVQIKDATGTTIECFIAWVFVNQLVISIDSLKPGCPGDSLLNANFSKTPDFRYFNPPPEPFIIDANTEITVCFDALHTWVSDIGFVLWGPASCGNTGVAVYPHPAVIDPINTCCCNDNNDVNNLCFSTTSNTPFVLCDLSIGYVMPPPFTGTYEFYQGAITGGSYPNGAISDFYGCNAALGDWRVQIYDCVAADFGSLQSVTLTFSTTSNDGCQSNVQVVYSDSALNSPINDNSCNTNSASVFSVPLSNTNTTPIVYDYSTLSNNYINTNNTFLWSTSNSSTVLNANTSLNTSLASVPQEDTWIYLTASDHLGCTFIDSVFYNYDPPPIDSLVFSNITCHDSANGTFQVFATWLYDISLNGGPWLNTTGLNNLDSGAYELIVRDTSLSCIDTVNFTIIEPDSMEFVVSSTNVSCSNLCDGMGQVIVAGGTPNYSYLWNPINLDTNLIDSLCQGKYNVTVTDSFGCQLDTSFIISGPTPFIFVTDSDSSACGIGTGMAVITVSGGGTAPYSYLWDDLNQTTDSIINNVPGGIYTVTLTDASNCDTIVSIEVPKPDLPILQIIPSDTVICYGDSLEIRSNVTGGASPYTYNWSTLWTGSGPHYYSELQPGCFNVYVLDINNCSSDTIERCIDLYEPLESEIIGPSEICSGDSVSLSSIINGGDTTATLQYDWSTGGTLSEEIVLFNGIYPQSFIVQLNVSDGCSLEDSTSIQMQISLPLLSEITPVETLDCYPPDVLFKPIKDASSGTWVIDDKNEIPMITTKDNEISFGNPGTYNLKLIVTNPAGCPDTAELDICVRAADELFIPDVFSPNNNGLNDLFKVYIYRLESGNIRIYNRWGQTVYRSSDLTEGWDGTTGGALAPSGVYIYELKFTVDGNTSELRGDFTLIR